MGLFSSISNAFSSLSDLVSPVTSFVSDITGTASSAYSLYNSLSGAGLEDQKELMEYQAALQDQYWRSQYGSRHQLEVEDLKNAGLNPILSATGNSGSAGGVSGSATPNETRSQKLMANAQAQQALQTARLFEANSAKALSDANLNGALTYKANGEAGLQDAYFHLSKLETEARIRQLDSMTRNQDVQTFNAWQYPQNQGRIARELNSLEGFLKRRGFGSNHSPAYSARSGYEIFPNDE